MRFEVTLGWASNLGYLVAELHLYFHICKIMSSHDASHIFVCFMYPSQ